MQANFTQEAINHYLHEITKMHKEDWTSTHKKLDDLFVNLLTFYTDQFKIPFNSVFSQTAFTIAQTRLDANKAYLLHHYRIEWLQKKAPDDDGRIVMIKTGIISILNDAIFNATSEVFAEERIFAVRNVKKQRRHTTFIAMIRFSVTAFGPDGTWMEGTPANETEVSVRVLIDPGTQAHLVAELKKDLPYYTCPFEVVLINVKVINEEFHPEMVVLLPDFLIDVTAIAECFGPEGANPEEHLIRKLTPKSVSDALFIGLCANYFLDELIFRPNAKFEELVIGIFRINPLYLALKSNDEIKTLLHQIKTHFDTLFSFVQNYKIYGLANLEDTLIEPSYASPKYGIQGRLDLYIDQPAYRSIIELKSGSIFRPNSHGLNQSHYIQTLLYNLLVHKGQSGEKDVKAYILYSKMSDRPLRYAPPIRPLQLEALIVRNTIMTIEYRLSQIDANGNDPTNVMKLFYLPHIFNLIGFTGQDAKFIRTVLEGLSPIQSKYFKAYLGFTAREYFSAKSGFRREQMTTGQASLWLSSTEEKINAYTIMPFLRMNNFNSDGEGSLVVLNKSERTSRLADFRTGDVIVLYETDEQGDFLWEARQLYKGTVIENQSESVTIKLRSRQKRADTFGRDTWWNLEKDTFDSSFSNQFKCLMGWATASPMRKDLLLGLRPPDFPKQSYSAIMEEIDPDLDLLLWRAINAPQYFLLWGPPGTGKTSFMIKHMIRLLAKQSDMPILVFAYTNRAVDELCEAIESIVTSEKPSYLRIGSRYGTDPAYQDKLLDQVLLSINSRNELIERLNSTKVFIGTASSINGKQELFRLLQFEWAIIDEASQILDPQLVDILTKVERFVMIGDHKQLPAVVTQHPDWTQVTDSELLQAGIENLSDSLFERLYRQAVRNNWDWAYGLLYRQGRMHQEIMDFPAHYFYDNHLKIWSETQALPMGRHTSSEHADSLEKILSTNRVLFLAVKNSPKAITQKMNSEEALVVKQLIQRLDGMYQNTETPLEKLSIGIITPFRNQIINIINTLGDMMDRFDIVVDTVERFQGGAKDIVLLSMVVSHRQQMKAIVSLNREGIDRKLNVALTRARQRLIMIGNPEALSDSPYYMAFIERYHQPFELIH